MSPVRWSGSLSLSAAFWTPTAAGVIVISSRSAASPSASPSPHSTTVTEAAVSVSRSRSSSSSALPSRYASACTSAGGAWPAAAGGASGGCTRAITNVGEVIGPRTPSPSPIPWVSVVLPAPSPPLRITRSPARSTVASERPRARISAAVATVSDTSGMVRPPHARADTGHNLVGDRAKRLAPFLGGRFPVIPGPEEHDLIPFRHRLVAEVNDQLVHAHRARDRPPPAARG